MSNQKPRHSHPYFRPVEDRLPKHRAGRRVLIIEPAPKRVDFVVAS